MIQVFYKDDTFCLSYSEDKMDNIFYIHCTVDKWTLNSFKRGLYQFKLLHEFARNKGVKGLVTLSQNPKFCELLAGVEIGEAETADNQKYKVYKWDLIQ